MHWPLGRVTPPGQVLCDAVGWVEANGLVVVCNNAIVVKEAFNTPPLKLHGNENGACTRHGGE